MTTNNETQRLIVPGWIYDDIYRNIENRKIKLEFERQFTARQWYVGANAMLDVFYSYLERGETDAFRQFYGNCGFYYPEKQEE